MKPRCFQAHYSVMYGMKRSRRRIDEVQKFSCSFWGGRIEHHVYRLDGRERILGYTRSSRGKFNDVSKIDLGKSSCTFDQHRDGAELLETRPDTGICCHSWYLLHPDNRLGVRSCLQPWLQRRVRWEGRLRPCSGRCSSVGREKRPDGEFCRCTHGHC